MTIEPTFRTERRVVALEGVPSRAAKRRAILDAARLADDALAPCSRPVTKAAALRDVERFRARLFNSFAYPGLRHLALEASLDAIRAALPEDVSVGALARPLRGHCLRSGDGFASVTFARDPTVTRFAPFLLEEVEDGVVAVRPERAGLVERRRAGQAAIVGWLVFPEVCHQGC